MGQEVVLIWLYEQSKLFPDKKFKSEEIIKGIQSIAHEDITEVAISHSIQRLLYWSFIKRDISITGWKNSYSITPLGISTAETWIDLKNKNLSQVDI